MASDEVAWLFDECNEEIPTDIFGSVGSELPDVKEIELADDDKPIPQPCYVCKGTGECYCIRKGSSEPSDCVRCGGTGKCKHCGGRGRPRWETIE